eukprot:1110120-Rhodomonas_salina.1
MNFSLSLVPFSKSFNYGQDHRALGEEPGIQWEDMRRRAVVDGKVERNQSMARRRRDRGACGCEVGSWVKQCSVGGRRRGVEITVGS